MPPSTTNGSEPSVQPRAALSRWDGEGGAGPDGPQDGSNVDNAPTLDAPISPAEWNQLRVRTIALETIVVALLVDASEQQVCRVRQMAHYISPRSGVTPHPVTLQAAAQMTDLVARAEQVRSMVPS